MSREVLLLLAIAAAEGCSVYKTDPSQAFLYGSMENDVVYIRAPDWWPEPIPEGQEHLWYPTGCTQVAPANLGMDGGERLPRGK
jgi:hypothetical protein